jgi:hypothetical protein
MDRKFREDTPLLYGVGYVFLFVVLVPVGIAVSNIQRYGSLLGPDRFSLINLFVVSAMLHIVALLAAKMRTEVDAEGILITYGILGVIKKRIPLSQVRKAEAVKFGFWNFGGWGIRLGKLDKQLTAAYLMKGCKGVLLNLSSPIKVMFFNVNRIIIGTDREKELIEAIGK